MSTSIQSFRFRTAPRLALAVLALSSIAGTQLCFAQDTTTTVTELNEIMQKVAGGADLCPYMPRLKELIRQLASETPEMYDAMRPALAQMESSDDGCNSDAPASRSAAPPPSAPPVAAPPAPRPLERQNPPSMWQQVNQARLNLNGVNRLSLPPGEMRVQPSGAFSLTAPGQRQFTLNKAGALTSITTPAGNAKFWPNGRLSAFHTSSMTVSQGPLGQRTTTTNRPDGSIVVTTGPHSGYLEQSLKRGGQTYIQRNYVTDGTQTTRLYLLSNVAGKQLPVYVPRVFYTPKFYDWVNGSWGSAVPYSWPWLTDQVCQTLAAYFTPDGTYNNPVQWLTDFLLSKILPAPGPEKPVNGVSDTPAADGVLEAAANTPIGPNMKQALAESVQDQLRNESKMAVGNLAAALVVSPGRDAEATNGSACWLGSGDILRLAQPLGAADETGLVVVISSRQADCPVGTSLRIPVADLNAIQNEMRAALDDGLAELHTSQRQAGWPPPPAAAIAPPPKVILAPSQSSNPEATALITAARQDTASTANNFVQAAFAQP